MPPPPYEQSNFLKAILFEQTRQYQKLIRQVIKPKCFVSAYIALNVGDDLFVSLLINRYPHVIFFLPADAPYTMMFKDNPNVICEVNRFYQHNFLDDFTGYDFAVSIGGSLYQSHFIEEAFQRDAGFFNRFVKAGKPLFIIGSNFDRDYGNASRDTTSFHELFARGGNLLQVSLRDKHSYSLFRDLKNVTYAPDVIFGLSDNFLVPKENRAGLGISVISTRRNTLENFHEQYLRSMLAIIRSAIKRAIEVKIFSFCVQEGDHKMVEEIIQNLMPQERLAVKHVIYTGDLVHFLQEFAAMKYIVATRFHANVLALKFRQNLFPIVYNDKTLSLLEDLKVFSSKEFYDLRIGKTLDEKNIWKSLEKIRNLDSKILEWTMAAEHHFHKLDKYLLSLPN